MESDGVIVSRVIAGDHEVYGQLVSRYAGAVEAKVLVYVQKRSMVKQLANDIFAKGFLRLKTLRDSEKFRPWIFRMAEREVVDYQRKCIRDRQLSEGLSKVKHYLSRVNVPSGAAPELLEQKERLERLSRAILELKPKDREIIGLRYFEGRSTREISEKLKTPDGTIRCQIHRCHLKLYQLMRGHDYVEKT